MKCATLFQLYGRCMLTVIILKCFTR